MAAAVKKALAREVAVRMCRAIRNGLVSLRQRVSVCSGASHAAEHARQDICRNRARHRCGSVFFAGHDIFCGLPGAGVCGTEGGWIAVRRDNGSLHSDTPRRLEIAGCELDTPVTRAIGVGFVEIRH